MAGKKTNNVFPPDAIPKRYRDQIVPTVRRRGAGTDRRGERTAPDRGARGCQHREPWIAAQSERTWRLTEPDCRFSSKAAAGPSPGSVLLSRERRSRGTPPR